MNTEIDSVYYFMISEKNVVLREQRNATALSSPPLWYNPVVLNS